MTKSLYLSQAEYVVPAYSVEGESELRLPATLVHDLARAISGEVTERTVERAVNLLIQPELAAAWRTCFRETRESD